MRPELSAIDEFYFQWHITERCNNHCRHCYQNGHPIGDLPLANLELILGRMDQALKKWDRLGSLSFTGGEPLLRKANLFQLMDRVDHLDSFAYYDVLSNGSLISNDIARSLKERAKLRRVQVSLEGSNPSINDAIRDKGSFDETMSAIKTMKRHGLAVSVMTTISRINYRNIPELVELLNSEGVDTVSFERLVPEGRGKALEDQMLSVDELRAVYETAYELSLSNNGVRILLYRPLFTLLAPEDPDVGALCSAGNNALTVMPDGTVYPCRRLPIPIGSVLTDGIFAIWYDSEVLWRIRNPMNLGGKCQSCDFLARCRGCRAMAYACSGDFMAEDPQCPR